MTDAMEFMPAFVPEQFRAVRLQVFNWGTFSGLHDIPISERGFLFVGKSGTGKSTLLDAFAALLVPPRWVDFNAAARETERTGRDRSVVSYVRGAWAEQKDGESGDIATRYLRAGTTWSALGLTYRNGAGKTIVLVQIFWIRGTSSASNDVKRHYLIFGREFELQELEDFGNSNLEIRRLKQKHPEAFARDEFRPYGERFCRLLGIENEAALRLLHKTQSAKNLGDLNTFLRDFMLDKPRTFEVADRLVSEFGELNAAHQAVVTAREQVQMLAPALEQFKHMQSRIEVRESLNTLQSRIRDYAEFRRFELLEQHIATLDVQASGLEGDLDGRKRALADRSATLRGLEQELRNAGGDRIERWETDKASLEQQRSERLRKHDQARAACKMLRWSLPDNPHAFAELVASARAEVEAWEERNKTAREEQLELGGRKKEAESAFANACKEVEALRRQPSNIPADMLELRRRIADAVGITEAAIPFAGELMEVKPQEAEWQGAIERVLRGFAVSLLVDERSYTKIANHINSTNLGQRLFYYRTVPSENPQSKSISADSLIHKLKLKPCSQEEWLRAELRSRFDYACVNSMQAFRRNDRALTREGQIKHSKTRHEKDDRRGVDDRLKWVLGFDNREKRAEFEKHAQDLANALSLLDKRLRRLSDEENQRAERRIQCQTLVNLQWQEIDAQPLVERIGVIDRQLREARQGSVALRRIGEQIESQRKLVDQADNALRESRVAYERVLDQIKDTTRKIAKIREEPTRVMAPEVRAAFDLRFAKLEDGVRLDNLDRLTTMVLQGLNRENADAAREIANCEKFIEARFSEFIRKWPAESGDVQPNLASAQDFFSKLSRLELDGLPAHEQRFFELLRNQSHQNLAALSTHLSNARKEILERMEFVNSSLSHLPFNRNGEETTYLHIDASDRQLSIVRDFKQEIQQALSHAWTEDRENAESRFLVLRRLVERLSSQAIEDRHWRDLVLDVRQHVEFIGREFDEAGTEVEIYRSGAGKSGGQRQKLATTCLAAALRYQLGGIDHEVPRYATVVLDEAFDKADNEFTTLAMNIFTSFGFQMIVATPLKSVMTLEPFIGGACFVDITDRRVSGVLLIEYETERHRLKLPDHARAEVNLEIS